MSGWGFEGSMLGAAGFGDFMRKDFPVLTEEYGVGLHSGVYLDGVVHGTLLHCYLECVKNVV